MGMYDTFRMPGLVVSGEAELRTLGDEEYQTKDLSCRGVQYFVTPDGRVLVKLSFEKVWRDSDINGRVYLGNLVADFSRGRLVCLRRYLEDNNDDY